MTSGVGEGYEGAEALVARREEGVAAGRGLLAGAALSVACLTITVRYI